MALSKEAFNVREREGGNGSERETETEGGAGEGELKHRHKICHRACYCKSFIVHLFVGAYFSKFYSGYRSEESSPSQNTKVHIAAFLCKMK